MNAQHEQRHCFRVECVSEQILLGLDFELMHIHAAQILLLFRSNQGIRNNFSDFVIDYLLYVPVKFFICLAKFQRLKNFHGSVLKNKRLTLLFLRNKNILHELDGQIRIR